MPGQEAGAAGDVERPAGLEAADHRGQLRELSVPAGAVAGLEQPASEVPVVVLGRALVVVLLHGLLEYGECCRSSRFPTSLKVAIPRRSLRSAIPWARTRGCLTCTPPTITTAPFSRWSDRSASWQTRWSPVSASRPS